MSNELQQSGLSNDNTNIAVTVDKEKVKKALAQIQEIPDANRLSNVKKHSEVLENLLNEIQHINFREYLKLPDDEDVKQKYIVVGVVKYLLETAKAKRWNLCKTFDYTYIYNGAYWLQMDKEDIKMFLGKCAVQMGCADYDARHYEFKEKLLKQFLTDAHLPQPEPDTNKILINLQNGTFEFTATGWTLRPFDAKDFITYQLAFSYEKNAVCPMFETYLLKVLPDENSRILLQEFAGYIFTKKNFEKMLMLTGSGANGKSVFFNILTSLLGKENILTFSMGLFKEPYNRAKLTNVLLNYSSEKGTELNADILKALVSSEPIQACAKYCNPFTLYNHARFIINANELPKETESTEAYFRRWLIILFDVKISSDEMDTELANKIIKSELTGVFNWLLKGVERIVRNGKFTHCEKSAIALNDFKKQSDSVALFIDEMNFKPSQTNKVSLPDLYNGYKLFCNDDNYRAVGKNKFSVRLENKGFERTRTNAGTYFLIKKE
jgi:putative DNA primase/helicase